MMKTLLKIVGLGALFVVTAVGLAAWVYRAAYGLGTSNLNSLFSWGLWVAFYIYFIGLSAGAFLLSSLVYVFGIKRYEKVGPLALYSALMALLAGLFFVLTDLGHMERFWYVFVHRQVSSVLCWEIYFYVGYIVILLGEIWFLLRHRISALAERSGGLLRAFYRLLALGSRPMEGKEITAGDRTMIKLLGVLGIPTAIGVHGGTGAIFAVVIARPYWFSPLLPIVFLVSALASGGALLTFVYAFFGPRDEEHSALVASLARLTGGILCLDLLLIGSELLVGLYGTIPEEMSAFRAILSSSRAWIFWFWQLAVGAAIPLFLIFYRRTSRSVGALGFAGLLVVLGVIGVRWNIVVPGYGPAFKALPAAYVDPRIIPFYTPSTSEYLSSIGIIGATIVVFLIGCRLLPILKTGEQT